MRGDAPGPDGTGRPAGHRLRRAAGSGGGTPRPRRRGDAAGPSGDFLIPTLAQWPVPDAPAAGRCWCGCVGDQVIGLRGSNARPLAAPDLVAARVIRGDAPARQDDRRHWTSRGCRVLRRGAPAWPDTEWYLVARLRPGRTLRRVDAAVRCGSSLPPVAWRSFAAWCRCAYSMRERQAAQMADLQRAEQGEKLRALALLDGISAGSHRRDLREGPRWALPAVQRCGLPRHGQVRAKR